MKYIFEIDKWWLIVGIGNGFLEAGKYLMTAHPVEWYEVEQDYLDRLEELGINLEEDEYN